jgi:hypothetical protein
MAKEENKADTHLVVESLQVLKDVSGAAFKQYREEFARLHSYVNGLGTTFRDFWSETVSDGVVSPEEKLMLLQQIEIINVEYPIISGEALGQGMSESSGYLKNYIDAWDALNVYLYEELQLFDNLNKPTEIPNRLNFIAMWAAYYDALVTLQFALQNKMTADITPTMYRVIPSAKVIKRYNSGAIEPQTISCAQFSITGNGSLVESNKILKYITSKDATETLYTGEAITVGEDWEWIKFILYDESGMVAMEDVPVLSDGPPATKYELLPSTPMIVKNDEGAYLPATITCGQQVVVGNNPPVASNKTIKYITSANATETVYTGAITVAWDWIKFRLYDNSMVLSFDTEWVYVVSDGKPAIGHHVKPSVDKIGVFSGKPDPQKISCSQFSITGNGLPTPSNKTLKYATSLSAEQPYTGEITVNPAWTWIYFALYDAGPDGEPVFLDGERVPVLADGESLIYLDLVDQHIVVMADEYGEPYSLPITTHAVLYNGNAAITHADYTANVKATSIVRYPGSGGKIFNPMLGPFYPTRSAMWSIAQGAIDQNGNITIDKLPHDKEEIEVKAFYNGMEYTTTLTLLKVRDGEAPAIIDIENENTSILCDSYGTPKPGELPLTTKAFFFKGTKQVAPFWFLNSPPAGVSITQEGIITVAANAALGRANNILVAATYRDKTFTRMFTVTKALEGYSAMQYDLLPSADIIHRDAAGNYTPATIACGQQVTVGNTDPKPSDKTIKYITSASATETVYAGPIAVAWDWIEFILYDGISERDRETVPVVSDGENSITINIVSDTIIVRCDAYGVPYPGSLPILTKATLYDGGAPANAAWSLELPPPGVSIANDGTIAIAENATLGYLHRVKLTATYKNTEYVRMITVEKTLDGDSPITVDLFPPEYVIPCDYQGHPLQGKLPQTAQATLWKGTQEITAAMENAEAAKVSIVRYPGIGGKIFTPMMGPFYPSLGYPVAWALEGAPAGVTIDKRGLITISEAAQLGDKNSITVWATYHGRARPAILGISKARSAAPNYTWTKYADTAQGEGISDNPTGKKYIGYAYNKTTETPSNNPADYIWMFYQGETGPQGSPAPRYRGATEEPDTENTGSVTLKLGIPITVEIGDWVSYVGETEGEWENGYCMRWNGTSWTAIPISADGNFDTNPYVAALMDLTEGAPNGTFMSILVRDLIVKTAMIEWIQAQLIQISGEIFGGERFVRSQNTVVDRGNEYTGFKLGIDGILKATSAELTGIYINGNSKFYGEIESPVFKVNQGLLVSDNVRSTGSNKNIRTFIQEEFVFLDLTINEENPHITKDVMGSHQGKDVIKVHYYLNTYSPNRPVMDYSYIEIFYADGTIAKAEYSGSYGTISGLQFRYAVPSGWKVQMNNIPSEDPHISGVVWRQGTDLKISIG